ncbi:MAG: hypothetical protein WD407_15510 [Rhodospirillales bacterium]
MSSPARRELLSVLPNPEVKIDYVVTLRGRIGTAQESRRASIRLRYIPDKYILGEDAFRRYLDDLANGTWTSLEELAALILHDINNEVIGRWVQVTVGKTAVTTTTAAAAEGSERLHTVVIEDRQPRWDNLQILSRL